LDHDVGISNFVSMCTDDDVGITQAINYDIEVPIASRFSYELGCSLGMNLDDRRKMVIYCLACDIIGRCTKKFSLLTK